MRIEYTCEDGSRTVALWPSLALLYWLGRAYPIVWLTGFTIRGIGFQIEMGEMTPFQCATYLSFVFLPIIYGLYFLIPQLR